VGDHRVGVAGGPAQGPQGGQAQGAGPQHGDVELVATRALGQGHDAMVVTECADQVDGERLGAPPLARGDDMEEAVGRGHDQSP
jgi:hypothetical protein